MNHSEIIALRREIYTAVREEKAQVLTLERARQLIGKKIATIYYGYAGQDGVEEFTVGSIQSEWDFYSGKTFPDSEETYHGRWMKLDKERPSRKIVERAKNRFFIITADGAKTFIYLGENWKCYFDEPTFTSSDADREVYFIER